MHSHPTRRHVLLSIVGQFREFEVTARHYTNFIKSLTRRLNTQYNNITTVHLSIVTWDTSFYSFPKGIRSFIETNITVARVNQTLVDAGIYSVCPNISIKVVPDNSDIVPPQLEFSNVGQFVEVAYLHHLAYTELLQIEQARDCEFSNIILSRPDVIPWLDSLNEQQFFNMPRGSVGCGSIGLATWPNITAEHPKHGDEVNYVEYDEFSDVVNLFDRTAFMAYGLMYYYMLAESASAATAVGNYTVHYWVPKYFSKFRITRVSMPFFSVKWVILRPTWRISCPNLPSQSYHALEDAAVEMHLTFQRTRHQRNVTDAIEYWSSEFNRHQIPYTIID